MFQIKNLTNWNIKSANLNFIEIIIWAWIIQQVFLNELMILLFPTIYPNWSRSGGKRVFFLYRRRNKTPHPLPEYENGKQDRHRCNFRSGKRQIANANRYDTSVSFIILGDAIMANRVVRRGWRDRLKSRNSRDKFGKDVFGFLPNDDDAKTQRKRGEGDAAN